MSSDIQLFTFRSPVIFINFWKSLSQDPVKIHMLSMIGWCIFKDVKFLFPLHLLFFLPGVSMLKKLDCFVWFFLSLDFADFNPPM